MKLLSGKAPVAFLLTTFAVGVLALAPTAMAQTGTETAPALKCLLDHGPKECRQLFIGHASLAAMPWMWWTPNEDFRLGALVSSGYARTETAANPFITKFMNGRTADVYDVKFLHEEKTFYISPPGPDGKIRYMLVRDGGPDDETRELFSHGPG